jgi:molecular chaperone DnaJ
MAQRSFTIHHLPFTIKNRAAIFPALDFCARIAILYNTMKNPYEILGVAKSATEAEIKSAYRKLVLKHHPDKNPGDKSAEEKFKDINNAYDILKDPQKKAAYDQFGDAAFGAGNGAGANPFGGNPFGNGAFRFNMGGFDMADMMDEVFKNFGFGSSAQGAAESGGRDMLHEIEIDLRDAYFGVARAVKYSSNVKCEKCGGHGTKDGRPAPTCKTCHGTGYVRSRGGFFATERPCPDCNGLGRVITEKCNACDGTGVRHKRREIEVRIPAGVEDGARLRLAGQGEAAPFGGPAGDLYIDVHVRPHQVFRRAGSDLVTKQNIPFATLALGGTIDIATIDDKTLSVKINAGTQVGDRLRVRGKGMPILRAGLRGGHGDLFIEVATSVPTKLSSKQKKALEEFRVES